MRLRLSIFVWTFLIAALTPALAEKRVALVIGNSDYQNVSPLTNPANDAAAIAAILTKANFDEVGDDNTCAKIEMKKKPEPVAKRDEPASDQKPAQKQSTQPCSLAAPGHMAGLTQGTYSCQQSQGAKPVAADAKSAAKNLEALYAKCRARHQPVSTPGFYVPASQGAFSAIEACVACGGS